MSLSLSPFPPLLRNDAPRPRQHDGFSNQRSCSVSLSTWSSLPGDLSMDDHGHTDDSADVNTSSEDGSLQHIPISAGASTAQLSRQFWVQNGQPLAPHSFDFVSNLDTYNHPAAHDFNANAPSGTFIPDHYADVRPSWPPFAPLTWPAPAEPLSETFLVDQSNTHWNQYWGPPSDAYQVGPDFRHISQYDPQQHIHFQHTPLQDVPKQHMFLQHTPLQDVPKQHIPRQHSPWLVLLDTSYMTPRA